MKWILQSIFMVAFNLSSFAQNATITQLEHSLRWLTESNFPSYIQDPMIEQMIIETVEEKIKHKLNVTKVEAPDHIDYRLISMFGKSKVKLPKSFGTNYKIGISSLITRGTSNHRVFWQMKIQIKQNKNVTFENEIEHELSPFSVSHRLSKLPWLDENEFQDAFSLMLEECLELEEFTPGVINFGSLEMIEEKISKLISIEKKYLLAVAGDMMGDSNSNFKILDDTVTVSEFSFRSTNLADMDFNISGSKILAGLFKEISGIDSYYNFKSKEKRSGIIFDHAGTKRSVRLDWLEEVVESTSENDEPVSRIVSPITGRYFDRDSLVAEFIFYHQIQEIKSMNFQSLHEEHFQLGDDDIVESLYAIIGYFGGTKFEVVYRELDQLIFIRVQDELQAVFPRININPESNSFNGVRLSKKWVRPLPRKNSLAYQN
jgi:hypothetical protein